MLGKIEIDAALSLNNNCVFIDVRSPHEYEMGTIPGAINIPLLDNEERVEIGKLYKTQGVDVAKIRGLEIVSPKLPYIYQQLLKLEKENNQIIVFCARGGLRSTAYVSIFKTLGLELLQLQSGFKAYRNYLLDYLNNIHQHNWFIVLHGFTGVGKTDILKMLQEKNVPIIDLEELACNKGSVFGEAIDQSNRDSLTQKNFENSLLQQLIVNKGKFVIVESESQRLGQVSIPKEIYNAMKNGKHILIDTSIEVRVSRLVNDYVNEAEKHDEMLSRGVRLLKKRLGNEKVGRYIQWIEDKKYQQIAKELIRDYYDPLYQHSIEKYNYDLKVNYDKIEEAVNQIAIFYKVIEGKTNQ